MLPVSQEILTLGHSPDPDDAFMFYAMAANKIDLRGYQFKHILQDIETLNQRATRGELHVSAVSIHALAYVLDRYALLPSGASMGDGYGPVLVTAPGFCEHTDDGSYEAERLALKGRRIAIPGTMTSAFLALQLFLKGTECRFVVTPFDQIMDVVKRGEADVGLLIHEGQLTYKQEGFEALADLGVWWKATTGLPLPLGGNVVRKDLEPKMRQEISEIIQESIHYGLEHRAAGVKHSMPLARGLGEPLVDRFIGMYVNDLTCHYGEIGRAAVETFLRAAHQAGFIPAPVELEFV